MVRYLRAMSNVLEQALQAAKKRQDQVLPTLERWVRQNSFSENIEGVNKVGDMLAEDLELDGLTLDRRPGDGVGDHLFWQTPAWESRPEERRLLIGHHDTVFPPGTFEVWETSGDILRGPGVLDMKGGLVTIRTALAALADVGALADVPLSFVSVADEEIGSRHSCALLQEHAKGAKAALVFEAGRAEDMIITQRKGTGRVTVTALGKAAHAGNHHKDGINAIWALAQWIDTAQEHTDYSSGLTCNVGLISGGSSANTVPAKAQCTVDFRYISKQDGEDLVASLEREAGDISKATGATLQLDGGIRRPPLERNDESVALYKAYAECARAAGLGDTECPLIGGGSDANMVSAVGVPAIDGLGPRGRGFHTHDEFIEMSSLALRVEALVRYLLRSS